MFTMYPDPPIERLFKLEKYHSIVFIGHNRFFYMFNSSDWFDSANQRGAFTLIMQIHCCRRKLIVAKTPNAELG